MKVLASVEYRIEGIDSERLLRSLASQRRVIFVDTERPFWWIGSRIAREAYQKNTGEPFPVVENGRHLLARL